MAGNSSVTGLETVTFTDNMSFDGTKRGGAMTTNGELFIGSTLLPHVRKGSITSPLGTLSIGYSAPNITLDLNGGGQSVQHLTGDTGGQLNPTSNNFNIYGKKAGSVVQVMEVDGSVSTLNVENRTWQTQYVVDTVTTVGLRGTFSSIQSAIDQGVADGKSGTDPINIFVRSGITLSGNFTLPAGVMVNIFGEDLGLSSLLTVGSNGGAPTISGTVSFASTSICNFSNLYITSTLTIPSDTSSRFSNCTILNASCSNDTRFSNCYLTLLSFTGTFGSSSIQLDNCWVTNVISGTDDCIAYIYNSQLYQINLSDNASISIQNSYFISASLYSITGTGTGTIYLFNSKLGSRGINGAFYLLTSSLSSVSSQGNLLSSGVTTYLYPSLGGNVKVITKTAISYIVERTNQYIGVTDTSSARTITLPNTASSSLVGSSGQVWTIKDESGGAGTNNITIATNGGNIDGAATFVINQNYGSADVMFDGTNYFLI